MSQPVEENGKTRRYRGFGGDWLDIWLTLFVVAGAVAALFYYISGLPKDMHPILLLSGTIAGLAGWGTGILFSPYGSDANGVHNGGGWRLMTGLIVGFLAAWFWQPVKEFFTTCGSGAAGIFNSGMMPVLAVAVIIFLLAMITTYVLRSFNRVRG